MAYNSVLKAFGRWLDATSAKSTATASSPTQPHPGGAVTLKVLVINFAPLIRARGGNPLHRAMGWNDPRALSHMYINDLAECSGGYVQYQMVEWQDVNAFPLKQDGFRYTDDSYLRCWAGQEPWHQPDQVDYHAILNTYRIPARIESGEIDEVWLWGFPYAGFWESTMAGQGAYFCNSPPVPGVATSRPFVVMGFSYERGVGEMLENFGHRTESILTHVFGSWEAKETHAWNRFTLIERNAPGRAAVGNIHFAPNSTTDYDWGNPTPVWSTCDDWLNYPNLTGQRRQVDCREWGQGDIRAHHRWWLRHLPRAEGRTDGIHNNWWAYVIEPHKYPESRS